MIFIAHRGASRDYPENTLLAFRKALEAGATWLELDVHLTADGSPVVIHDERLERTTDGCGLVRATSLRELRTLDAGRGEKIPLLSEVLALITADRVLNIELKGHGTAQPTARLLRERLESGALSASNLLLSSLELRELEVFRALLPELRLAAVFEFLPDALWSLVERLRLWSVHVALPLVTAELVEEAHRRGVHLFVFTVNLPVEVQSLRQLGVDGVFTDVPSRWFLAGC